MPTKMIVTGDINLMNVTDPMVPFSLVENDFRASDIVFCNLECCLYEPPSGHSVEHEGFYADPSVAGEAPKSAGIHAAGVANAIQQRYRDHNGTTQNNSDGVNEYSDDVSPNALVTAIEAYRKQRNSHEYDRAQREHTTVIILSLTAAFALLAAGAAIATVILTHQDTRDLIIKAEQASNQQHADTLAALGKTDDTIGALRAQTDVMRDQLTEMRSAGVDMKNAVEATNRLANATVRMAVNDRA